MEHIDFFNRALPPRLSLRWVMQPYTVEAWISFDDWQEQRRRGLAK
jgi:hypothetical protein